MLIAAFSKSSTFISFYRFSDVGFSICVVQISFASVTHTIIFFIVNHLGVNKPIFEMMVSSVTVILTLSSFLNSGSFSLAGLICHSFTNFYLSNREMMEQKTIHKFSLYSLHLILWMHNLQDYSERIPSTIVQLF